MMERLTFNAPRATAPSLSAAPPPSPPSPPRSATAAVARTRAKAPRGDWAFTGTLVFTAILFLRPQDAVPPLAALHLAELSALAALTAMVAGHLARREPIARMTPELGGVLAFGLVILATAPFSTWFGGSIAVFTGVWPNACVRGFLRATDRRLNSNSFSAALLLFAPRILGCLASAIISSKLSSVCGWASYNARP